MQIVIYLFIYFSRKEPWANFINEKTKKTTDEGQKLKMEKKIIKTFHDITWKIPPMMKQS